MKYCNINFEGPDCSGKTTLHKKFQVKTNFKYSAHDRCYASMFVHEVFFNRDNQMFWLNKLIEDIERNDSLYVFILPEEQIIYNRFISRGDEYHKSFNDIEIIYDLFKLLYNTIKNYNNVICIKGTDFIESINIIERKLGELNYESKQFL